MSVLIFFVILFILILVHEWGHFIVAKKSGMRVDEFGIGFPPRLFSYRWGKTRYSLNALPIGGFVSIHGENGATEEVGTDQLDEGSFASKSKWAQAAVLVAGVAMNVLLAFLLFLAVLLMGVATPVSEQDASEEARLVVAEVVADSPAMTAGVPIGATITSLATGEESLSTPTPRSFATFVRENPTEEISIDYRLGEETSTAKVTPAQLTPEGAPIVGIRMSLVDTISYPLFEAIKVAAIQTYETTIAITVGIAGLLRDAVLLEADLDSVAGPVGIVGMVGDAASIGVTSLLLFTAIISLNLAVINLLPFPALDGGRLVMVAIEAVMRRPINPVWVGYLNMIGFALLILLMVAITINDIGKF